MYGYRVIGSCHCSYFFCNSDAEARELFSYYYPAEPILSVKKTNRSPFIC